MIMNQSPKLSVYIGISVLAMLVFLALPRITTRIAAENATSQQPPSSIDYFSTITIKARAAYVYDIAAKKVLYEKNADEPLPLASLTKIMTAVTAADLAPNTTLVTINSEDLKQEGDSGLYSNERWTLATLLQYMLVVSSNDGAAAVASSLGLLARRNQYQESSDAFIEKMNSKAQDLKLTSMRFYNPSGVDISATEAGAYGSASDVALLLTQALTHYQNIIEPTRYASFQIASIDNIIHQAQNTDILVNKIPGLIAGKTGYTELAGGNLAIIFDAGIQHPIAVVVLGSTYNDRFSDVDTLVKASVATIVSGR